MPLKRHKSLVALSHDHHHGLILAQILKKDTPPYKGLPSDNEGKAEYTSTFFDTELVKHFNEEENLLYPYLKGKDTELDSLFLEIIDEHKQMTSLVDLIKKKINLADNLNDLGVLLSDHIRKEERKLFPLIQEVLDDDELDRLGERLERKGT